MSDKNVQVRLKFAREYKNWTIVQLDYRVIWSDGSTFNRFQSDGEQYCWRRPGKRIQRRHGKQAIKHGNGNNGFWMLYVAAEILWFLDALHAGILILFP